MPHSSRYGNSKEQTEICNNSSEIWHKNLNIHENKDAIEIFCEKKVKDGNSQEFLSAPIKTSIRLMRTNDNVYLAHVHTPLIHVKVSIVINLFMSQLLDTDTHTHTLLTKNQSKE